MHGHTAGTTLSNATPGASVLPQLTPVQMTAPQAFQAGEKMQAEGNWEKALLLYKTAVEKDPTHCPSWINMGAIFGLLGRYGLAQSCHKIAYESQPDNTAVCVNYANSLRLAGEPETAIGLLEKHVDNGVRTFNLSLTLALSYIAVGRYAKATPYLKEARAEKPSDAQTLQAFGVCAMVAGQQQESLSCLLKAELLDPLHSKPLWQGDAVLDKTLFIHGTRAEELFLALRFMKTVKEKVGKIVLQVPAAFKGFFATWPGVDHVVSAHEADQKEMTYDYQMTYLGVVAAFGSDTMVPPLTNLSDIKIDLSQFLKQTGHLKVGMWIENAQKFLPIDSVAPDQNNFMGLGGVDRYLLNPQEDRFHFYHPSFQGQFQDLSQMIVSDKDLQMVIRHMDIVIGTPSMGILMSVLSGVKTIVITEQTDHWLWQRHGFGASPWFSNLFILPVRPQGKQWQCVGEETEHDAETGTIAALLKTAMDHFQGPAERRDAA